jgi:hypothetical protein
MLFIMVLFHLSPFKHVKAFYRKRCSGALL